MRELSDPGESHAWSVAPLCHKVNFTATQPRQDGQTTRTVHGQHHLLICVPFRVVFLSCLEFPWLVLRSSGLLALDIFWTGVLHCFSCLHHGRSPYTHDTPRAVSCCAYPPRSACLEEDEGNANAGGDGFVLQGSITISSFGRDEVSRNRSR